MTGEHQNDTKGWSETMKKLKLQGKLIVSVGILMASVIVLLSIMAYISLYTAYQRAMDAKKGQLDQIIQSQVECLVGVLEANYTRFESGEITDEQARNYAAYIVRNTRYNNGIGYFWADMADGTSAVHIKPEVEGTNRYNTQDEKGNYFVRDTIAAGDQPGGGFIDFYFTKPGENEAKAKRGFVAKFEPYGWYIGTGNYEEDMLPMIQGELDSSSRALKLATAIMFSCGGIVLIVSLWVIAMIAKKISKPIELVTDRLIMLSEGNLQDSVFVSQTADEVGMLTQALSKTVLTLRGYIENISYVLDELNSGNLDVQIELDYMGDFKSIKNSLVRTLGELNKIITQIRSTAYQVSAGADQVSNGAQALSQGATEQASSVEELAATINEISSQVKEAAANAEKSRKQAQRAGDQVNTSNQQMQEMISAIGEISSKSDQIGKIIKTIEDIAFQTNILALNAAVEAARAGAAGKGFAVVADEVRNLASKSSAASKNTSMLIEGTIQAVEKGTNIASATAESLNSVVEITEQVVTSVDKIASATEYQASSIAQVTQGVDQISSVVQTNSATAEESAAASEELSGQAQMLKSLVGQFKLKESSEAQSMIQIHSKEEPERLSPVVGKY